MLTRYVSAATAAVFTLASLRLAAQPPPDTKAREIAIDRQVKVSQPIDGHEAVAQRFDALAAQLEKQAAEHERLAQQYRSSRDAALKQYAAKLALHCDRIARNLKEVAADARDTANIHRNILHKLLQ